jgi:DNA-binding response OmpR family regulator
MTALQMVSRASRVLVIDDSTTLRKLVEIAMRGSGVAVDFAATGSDGVHRARAARPDVILLDYLLPDLASTEVCQQLGADTITAHVPVVVMSANEAHVLESFRSFPSVVGFVGKPFSPTEIRSRLEAAIKRGEPVHNGHAAPVVVAAPPEPAPTSGELELRGDLVNAPLLEILRLLASSNATGTLTIDLGEKFFIHLRRGEVLLCSTTRFEAPAIATERIAVEVLSRARKVQQQEGKPALVTLTQAGALPVNDLPAELHRQSGRLLGELLGLAAGRFSWRAALSLPDYVDAFGRHVSVTSIALARQREPGTSLPGVFLDEVFDRMPRFSEKLAGARLSGAEQRVLALIDGRLSVREIVARGEIPSDQAAAIFARLRNVSLIRSDDVSGVSELVTGSVVVLDGAADFVAALRTYLAQRPQPLELVTMPVQDDIASSVLKHKPRLVLVGGKLASPELVARDIGPIARAGTVTVAGVLEFPDPDVVEELLRAGLHAVLSKPLHVNELERLLGL